MWRRALTVVVLLAAALAVGGQPTWPDTLPQLRLQDPLGREYTDAQLSSRGAIVVVTAPRVSQQNAQLAWNDAFEGLRHGGDTPKLVMLEDMSQSFFRPIVLSRMKAEYRPGVTPLLLLDEGGVTRKALRVAEDATVAFAFAPGGKLVAVETGEGTAERAEKLWRAIGGQLRATR